MSKLSNNKKEVKLFLKANIKVADLLKYKPVSTKDIGPEIIYPSFFKKRERRPRKKRVKDYRPELDSLKKFKQTFKYISDDSIKNVKLREKLDAIPITFPKDLEEIEKYGRQNALIHYSLYFNNVYKYKKIVKKFKLMTKIKKQEIQKKIDFELELHNLVSFKEELIDFKLMAFESNNTFSYDLFSNENFKLQNKLYDEDLNRIFINSESQNYNSYIHKNIIPETVLRDTRNQNNLEIDMVKEALYDYSLKYYNFGSDDESLPFASEEDLN